MKWTEHGEKVIYDSPWVSLHLADVEVPGGPRFDHHVIRRKLPAAGTGVAGDEGVLLLYRHRFITGTWGWEIPAGRVEEGETAEEAAAREVLEETGWQPGPVRHLFGYHPTNGISDMRFEIFAADWAKHVDEPSDPAESSKVEWVPVPRVRELVHGGGIVDGLSLTALTWWLLQEAR